MITNIFNKPQTYRAWNLEEKKWVLEGFVLSPVNGYPYWIDSGKVAKELIAVRSTGVYDINGVEIYECDIVQPVKFSDIPNIVEYVQHGFYRVKHHNGKKYINVLGSCQLEVIGNIFEHTASVDMVRIGNVNEPTF